MPHDHGIEDGVFIKCELVLAEQCDALSPPFANFAPVRLKLTCQDL